MEGSLSKYFLPFAHSAALSSKTLAPREITHICKYWASDKFLHLDRSRTGERIYLLVKQAPHGWGQCRGVCWGGGGGGRGREREKAHILPP